MAAWTADRYRELAEQCRIKARSSPPGKAKSLGAMAEEYEAKVAKLEAKR